MPFSHAIWLWPVAVALHVLEEYPRFISWAQQHASPGYTHREYVQIHAAAVISSALIAGLLWLFPNRALVLLAFTFAVAPGLLFNTFFHAGASMATGSYCPGVVTATLIYLPVFGLITESVRREGLLGANALIGSLAVAGVFHFWEVGHNVFKRW